jgi:hypothetical protein
MQNVELKQVKSLIFIDRKQSPGGYVTFTSWRDNGWNPVPSPFSAFRIPTSEFLKPYTLHLIPYPI